MTTAPLALPYHTDNGMYVLLTHSSILPLRTISKTREVNMLDADSSSVILLLGTGVTSFFNTFIFSHLSKKSQVTSWLLPESKLYAAPHGLPALATILSPGEAQDCPFGWESLGWTTLISRDINIARLGHKTISQHAWLYEGHLWSIFNL